MPRLVSVSAALCPLTLLGLLALQTSSYAQTPIPVTPDNFERAESDGYFAATAQQAGGVGKLHHNRDLMPVEKQTVVRPNRDTLYSGGIFDLDAGPVTVTMPDGTEYSAEVVTT